MLQLARGYEVILEPGDVLFFPSMWYHAVKNLPPVILIFYYKFSFFIFLFIFLSFFFKIHFFFFNIFFFSKGLTFGIDLPIIDPINSLKRNPLLTFGTVFNVKAAYHLMKSALSGKAGGKTLFFAGYLKNNTDSKGSELGQK